MSRPYRKIITRYVRFAPAFCRLFSCVPRLLTRAATATLTPSGANNDILVTAKTSGVAGNSLTAAIDVVSGGSTLSLSENSGAASVSSGDRYRITVSGTLSPDATGVVVRDGVDPINSKPLWRNNGGASYPYNLILWAPSTGTTGKWFLFRLISEFDYSIWDSDIAEFAAIQTPDLATGWEPFTQQGTGLTPTGNPSFTPSAATAAQAIALSQSSLSVTLTNAPGSDGTGVLSAVSATQLTGGI